MMKFFRKHNKELLAVFMAMLMVVFIGGSALEGMLRPSINRVVASSALGEISYADQREAELVTNVLDRIGESWRSPLGTGQVLNSVDWILLSREAKTVGTRVGEAAIRSTMTPQQLDTMSRQLKVKPTAIVHALEELISIKQTALTVAAGAAPSEAEIQSAARNVLEKVRINAVTFPAEAFVDEQWEFTDAEMQEQFEKYRDKEPLDGLNFGYYQAPAIRVQFFQIDRDKIADQLTIANIEKRARRYYDDNREKDRTFRRPADQMAASPDGPTPDPYLTWEEARELAERAVRTQQADEVAGRIADWLLSAANEPWINAERGDDGYKETPAAVESLDWFRDLIDKLPPSIAYPDAVTEWRSNFFTAEGANEVGMIGATFFIPERSSPTPFSNLVVKNKFMVPDISGNEVSNSAEFVAPFQPYPYPVKNRLTGSVFVFRVIEGRDGRPAESLDEVRDQVIADLRLKKAYDVAKARAENLASCDPEESLRILYESDPVLSDLKDTPERPGVNYYMPEPFARALKYEAVQGRPADGVMVFGGLGMLPNDVVDGLFALEYTPDHRGVFEIPERATFVVAEWVETNRPDDEAYLTLHEELSNQIAQRRRFEVLMSWMDPEQIRARNQFKLLEE